ncbi:putative lysosomal protective protein precursor [Immersiella caudata]|uniref:Lysosomal protective protein n=1 Tax=Immersiella caudata TaxID=314043 RepID=A0AA39WLK1_9PEZI|nr:putative lysosomal protective protein precursor [Immersiella caudata]
MLTASIILFGEPEGITVLRSKLHENVTISYKEPGICETTPGVKSYSGYVHLPPHFLEHATGEIQDYPINTFFWFFEALKNHSTEPLAIWLNGPGGSSLVGLLEANGPCFTSPDSKCTYLNPWSWNNEVNTLYIEQPDQVGFSYDIPNNSTLIPEMIGFSICPGDFINGVPPTDNTSRKQAAHALWHFAQTWFFEFPHYRPSNDRIGLWTESYGGHYGPKFMRFFREQNEKIDRATAEKGARKLHLDTLGIVNGCINDLVQGEEYFHFGYNNTYNISLFNHSTYTSLLHQWRRPGGDKDNLVACREALCKGGTTEKCDEFVMSFYIAVNMVAYNTVDAYDTTQTQENPFPPPYMHGYLTEEDVLRALGVPVNFTCISWVVNQAFTWGSYDVLRGGFLESIGELLDGSVKVHVMYGDRDSACNWVAGESASLAIPHPHQSRFSSAGYIPLLLPNSVKSAGYTRQSGNLPFSRIFNAGHEVPSYQPEAAYTAFMRAMFNRDIATGLVPETDELQTVGLSDIRGVMNREIPKSMKERCYVLKRKTCEEEEWGGVNGTAVVRSWVVGFDTTDKKSEWKDL